MANEHLATYLNDHLSGAVAALELLEDLEKSATNPALERFVAALRADVAADRQELEDLMQRLAIHRSRARRATAWVAERLAELKLRMDDSDGGELRRLESLEIVALGIEGKLALWRALAAAAREIPELQGVDYERLAQRAADQRQRVEPVRLDAARVAFGRARMP